MDLVVTLYTAGLTYTHALILYWRKSETESLSTVALLENAVVQGALLTVM